MNSGTPGGRFDDVLEPLGLLVGASLVVAGVGTVAVRPWATNPDGLAVAISLVGALATVCVGVALAWLGWYSRQ